jgi:hypothetical protein
VKPWKNSRPWIAGAHGLERKKGKKILASVTGLDIIYASICHMCPSSMDVDSKLSAFKLHDLRKREGSRVFEIRVCLVK